MCPSPHNIGPNPPNMVKHSALSIVPTEYIEKIHQLLLLIFLRPRSVTGNLGSECKYRVLGPDYSIKGLDQSKKLNFLEKIRFWDFT